MNELLLPMLLISNPGFVSSSTALIMGPDTAIQVVRPSAQMTEIIDYNSREITIVNQGQGVTSIWSSDEPAPTFIYGGGE